MCSSRIDEAIGKCVAVIFRRPDMCSLPQYKELLYWGISELNDEHRCLRMDSSQVQLPQRAPSFKTSLKSGFSSGLGGTESQPESQSPRLRTH